MDGKQGWAARRNRGSREQGTEVGLFPAPHIRAGQGRLCPLVQRARTRTTPGLEGAVKDLVILAGCRAERKFGKEAGEMKGESLRGGM